MDVAYDPLARRMSRRSKCTRSTRTVTPRVRSRARLSAAWSACPPASISSIGSDPGASSVPDALDEGLLEFYGMGGLHVRGGLQIGLVRILRDDLPCDSDGPKDGIGYTVLATSRDGVAWQRDRKPFLSRNPENGSWDHAMAWMSSALPVGDEVFFYYGGYARGHKIAAQDRAAGRPGADEEGPLCGPGSWPGRRDPVDPLLYRSREPAHGQRRRGTRRGAGSSAGPGR